MADVLERVKNHEGGFYSLAFRCPGCAAANEGSEYHQVHVEGCSRGPFWGWNGSMERPTFTPSILVQCTYGEDNHKVVCHSFVTDGQIRFLDDCTHPLAGQTVPLPPIQEG